MSGRRRTVYVALFAVAIVFNYGWLRVRPAVAKIQDDAAREQELLETRDRLGSQADLRGLAALEREVEALRRELAAEARSVEDHDHQLATPMQAGELAVQISALAEEVGLRFEREETLEEQRARSAPERPSRANLQRFLQHEPFVRPLRKWTLRGGFSSLWAFVSRLRTLPWRVVVLRLEVEQRQHLERYEPPLQITMTVAL